MSHAWREPLSRQVAEIEAVQAIFSQPGEFSFDYNELQAYEDAQTLLNSVDSGYVGQHNGQQQQAELGGRVHLLQEAISLRFRLPRTYPDTAPVLQVRRSPALVHTLQEQQ